MSSMHVSSMLFRQSLDFDDFIRFSKAFEEVFSRFLPTVQKVDFISMTNGENGLPKHLGNDSGFLALFRNYLAELERCVATREYIFLPYESHNGDIIVAVAQGADPSFVGKLSLDWLAETRAIIERECLLIKQARVDMQTGLLNNYNLHSLLSSLGQQLSYQLVLIELPPKHSGQMAAVRHVRKCAALLKQFLQEQFSSLHYLDHFTFGLLLRGNDNNKELGRVLVSYLKREGCQRVYVGSSSSIVTDLMPVERSGDEIYLEALEALHNSTKRGPFGFCDYSKIKYPDSHPLSPPPVGLLNKMTRKWRDLEQFCLVLLRGDSGSTMPGTLSETIDHGEIILFGTETFWLLPGVFSEQAVQMVASTLQKLNTGENTFSAGISYFPCTNFSKSATIANSRKALLHASYLGPGQVAVLDGTTLNISGDVYFGDGDLTQAVKEYRNGLKCNPDDVNLHNSLGVALIMMNKVYPAIRAFNAALHVSPDNCMALYNLGQAELERKNKQAAYTFLVRANACYDKDEEHQGVSVDLLLQLGELAVDQGDYHNAVQYLLAWRKNNESCRLCGRECLALGRAYVGLGKNKAAMVELQHALRFDEFDDKAIHLLGYLCFLEKEGDDIALALCRKSVELASGDAEYRLHLGIVEMNCGSMEDAEKNLRYCLSNKRYRPEAQLYIGHLYAKKGDNARARDWYRKVVRGEGPGSMKRAAEKAMREGK